MPKFYYSKKQSEHLSNNNKMSVHKDCFKINYCKLSNGDIVIYTDIKNSGYYDDMVCLGEGEYLYSDGGW